MLVLTTMMTIMMTMTMVMIRPTRHLTQRSVTHLAEPRTDEEAIPKENRMQKHYEKPTHKKQATSYESHHTNQLHLQLNPSQATYPCRPVVNSQMNCEGEQLSETLCAVQHSSGKGIHPQHQATTGATCKHALYAPTTNWCSSRSST